jgi:hypothetical protein
MSSTKKQKPDLRVPIGSRRLAVFVLHRIEGQRSSPAAPASFAEIGAKLEGYASHLWLSNQRRTGRRRRRGYTGVDTNHANRTCNT